MGNRRRLKTAKPRRVYTLTGPEMAQAEAAQQQMRTALDELETLMIVQGNTVMCVVAGSDDYADLDRIVPPGWLTNPDPEGFPGFWNLTVERQVAFRNWCARIREVAVRKDALMTVADAHLAMVDEDGGFSVEGKEMVNQAGPLLEDYTAALQASVEASDAFIDGITPVTQVDPSRTLVDGHRGE